MLEEADHKLTGLRTALLDILEDHTGAVTLPPAADTNEIVERVLTRIGPQGHILQVTPPEALKYQFEQEALARLKGEIEALEPRERKVIAWLEHRGQVTGAAQIALHVENRDFRRGGRYVVEFGQMLKRLAEAGLIVSLERQGYRPALRERVAERLAPYTDSDQEVEQVYQHLLHLLAEEGDHEEQG